GNEGTRLSIASVMPLADSGGDKDSRRAALASDPVLSATAALRIKAEPHPNPRWPEATPFWRVPELLPELARLFHVNFISDSYWNAPVIPVSSLGSGAPETLSSLLDRVAGTHYAWACQDENRLISLRSRAWYLDRPSEIPLRLIERWV